MQRCRFCEQTRTVPLPPCRSANGGRMSQDRRILRVLALEEITLGQALGILAETAERPDDPEQQALYQQAMDALRQMWADEP